MRILVIEDDMANRSYLGSVLARYGDVIDVDRATPGVDAFFEGHAQKNPLDVIFLDVGLDGLNGYQVEKEIRQFEAEHGVPQRDRVRIVMATGALLLEEVLKGFQLGCDLYLPKPFTREQIQGAMRELGYSLPSV